MILVDVSGDIAIKKFSKLVTISLGCEFCWRSFIPRCMYIWSGDRLITSRCRFLLVSCAMQRLFIFMTSCPVPRSSCSIWRISESVMSTVDLGGVSDWC